LPTFLDDEGIFYSKQVFEKQTKSHQGRIAKMVLSSVKIRMPTVAAVDTTSPGVNNNKRKIENMENTGDRDKRRKLMNRVAAQQSRDRKKAHLDDLEKEVNELRSENLCLKASMQSIEEKLSRLIEENASLKQQQTLIQQQQVLIRTKQEAVDDAAGCVAEVSSSSSSASWGILGSAVSIRGPQQQEQVLSRGAAQKQLLMMVMVRLMMLLQVTSQKTSSPSSQKFVNSLRSRISQLKMQTSTPCSAQKRRLPSWWGPHQRNWNPTQMARGNFMTPPPRV